MRRFHLRVAHLPLHVLVVVGLNAILWTGCGGPDAERDGRGGNVGNGASGNGASGNSGGGSGASGNSGLGASLNGDDSGSGSSSGGNICQSYQATSKPNPPTILILLDQSGSMNAMEGMQTRWAAATSSVTAATSSLGGVANFGLIGFPTHPITSDSDASQSCNAELKVAPAPDNGAAIAASIDLTAPTKGHTPVRAALNLARSELAKPEYAETARYVVLVTDGLPNCKGITPSSPSGYFANYEDPSDAVTTLRNDGVITYVVGYEIGTLIGDSEGVQHFAVEYADNMAEAGGTGSHYPVSNGAELEAVLSGIAAEVAPCSFDMDEAPRGGASYVRVSIDGKDYALNDPDGWVLEGDRTVALHEDGAACAVLRDGGEHSVEIQVECEPVVVR